MIDNVEDLEAERPVGPNVLFSRDRSNSLLEMQSIGLHTQLDPAKELAKYIESTT